jgi:hypothetical protein
MVANEQAAGSETTGADYASGAAETAAPEASTTPGEREDSAEPSSLMEQTQRIAEEQKSAAADRIGGVAEATERAADDLAREMPQAADALHAVAQRLDSAASALRERSIDEWINGAREFARNQPIAFFAGAVATGFALSRFLKSSSPGPQGHR